MPRPEVAKPLPSKERLEELLDYNPDTGLMTWKPRPLSAFGPSGKRSAGHLHKHYCVRFEGKPAGSTRSDGYATIMIDRETYKRSRLAWKIMTGEDPMLIDHISGNRGDDRFANLRSVMPQVNARNAALYANNKTGFPGVERHSRDAIWTAKIGVGGRQVHLGNFKTKEEAIACRIGAEAVLGYHDNRGRTAPSERKLQ